VSTNGQAPTILRRKFGGGHAYYLNDEKSDGVTTVLNQGFPKQALVHWAARACSQEVLDFWDELVSLPPSERAERVRTAPDRDRDAAARRGTEVHALALRLAAGEEVHVPDELVGHVDAYLLFAEEWNPHELLLEASVANLTWGYAGTLDLIADLNDGHRWLLDLKTNRSRVFAESALQLSAYRYAEWALDPISGKVEPMPEVDRCGVVWLRADRTYELRPVAASSREFRVFQYAQAIAHFSKRDDVIEDPIRAANRA
jgi:hypothetical protein